MSARRKTYRPWSPDESYLLPPSPREWLDPGHLVFFLLDIVEQLDLSAIEDAIQAKDPRGNPPYHPALMVALLLYGSCVGVVSSRRIQRATYEHVAFRVIAAGVHPEFSTICRFRRDHFDALAGLFVQVVRFAQAGGLVLLDHVSVDGSKLKANASRHKAMSYDRMKSEEERLAAELAVLRARAEQALRDGIEADEREDELYGPDKSGDEVPEELKRRESRLRVIQEAKKRLEAEARAARAAALRQQAEGQRTQAQTHPDATERKRAATRARKRDEAAEALERHDDDDPPAPSGDVTDLPLFGGPHVEPPGSSERAAEHGDTATPWPHHEPRVTRSGLPKESAQANFTNPESRIMEHQGAFVQAYNVQIAVDDTPHQIIVAHGLSNQAPDTYHLAPLLERIEPTCGALPSKATADTGYWAPSNAQWCEDHGVDGYIATGRMKRGWGREPPATGPPPDTDDARERMRHKVNTEQGKAIYRRRKCVPEPVFGQIKQGRGLRQFLHRGLQKVSCEWALYCTGHNLLKMFRATQSRQLTAAAAA